jgi:hypothetical protein
VHGVCECGMRTLRALHAWELDTYCDAAAASFVLRGCGWGLILGTYVGKGVGE